MGGDRQTLIHDIEVQGLFNEATFECNKGTAIGIAFVIIHRAPGGALYSSQGMFPHPTADTIQAAMDGIETMEQQMEE